MAVTIEKNGSDNILRYWQSIKLHRDVYLLLFIRSKFYEKCEINFLKSLKVKDYRTESCQVYNNISTNLTSAIRHKCSSGDKNEMGAQSEGRESRIGPDDEKRKLYYIDNPFV